MTATGINPDTKLVEVVEIPKHTWFMGVQFHPEYKSTVLNPPPAIRKLREGSIGAGCQIVKTLNFKYKCADVEQSRCAFVLNILKHNSLHLY